jgi:hypothetical protein
MSRRCIAFLIALTGCSFGVDQNEVAGEQNSCIVDSDCGTQRCEAGRCVTRAESELDVALVVTPKRTTNGTDSFPLVSAPFALRAGKQAITLPVPASVSVLVHDGAKALAAQLTFTQLMAASKFVSGTTQLNTVVPMPGDQQTSNNVLLLADTDYNVLIQPANADLTPHSMQFNASDGAMLDVDYHELKWQTHRFMFRNAPARAYNVRARAKGGGDVLSNSALIDFTGVVDLRFDQADAPYELELTPVEQAVYATKDGASCSGASPKPILTIDASGLTADKTFHDQLWVELPKPPDSIKYAGTVKLCEGQKSTSDLPISFMTTELAFAGNSNMVTGRFEVVSEATWDADAEQFSFCAQVPAGDYTVVVTPPANVTCEIFAERRRLSTPSATATTSEGEAAVQASVVLELRTPAVLSGTIQTPDRMPMANASIELLALGKSNIKSTITLAPTDRSVPLYNRSRQITSGAMGMFQLPVDLGTYDVIVKPPAQSNFAWRVLYGVDVGSRPSTPFATVISLMAPVVVSGTLSYADGSERSSLGLADVHAYTLVDPDMPTERSVEIGRGQADANGQVTLLLPPQLQKSWTPL